MQFLLYADINECLSSPCEHSCQNVQGSYKCSCYEGFKKINADPKSKQCSSRKLYIGKNTMRPITLAYLVSKILGEGLGVGSTTLDNF